MAVINQWYKGDLIRCSASFTNQQGTAVDPTTVTGTWTFSASGAPFVGVVNSATVTKDSTGNYHFDIDTTSNGAGSYAYKFQGTGANQAALDDQFTVRASLF